MHNSSGPSFQTFVKRLPPYAEFFIVVFVCFGNFILVSVSYLWAPPTSESSAGNDNFDFIAMTIEEAVSLFAVALFLSIRGWSRSDFGFRVTWLSTLWGLPLGALMYLTSVTVYAIALSSAGTPESLEFQSDYDYWNGAWPVMITFILVNSIFEECVVVGYIMTFIARRHGIAVAIATSASIRVLYHLYQGASAIFTIGSIGILAGLVYWRWKNLWPLIVGHSFINLWFAASQ